MIDRSKLDAEELVNVVMELQRKLGVFFDPVDVCDTIQYTIRKAEMCGEDESYIPILLENELRDHQVREQINLLGRLNHVRNMSSASMSSQVPECV